MLFDLNTNIIKLKIKATSNYKAIIKIRIYQCLCIFAYWYNNVRQKTITKQ